MLVLYPSVMLVYLYHYPEGKSVIKRILYMLMWVGIWAAWELGMITFKNCVYIMDGIMRGQLDFSV